MSHILKEILRQNDNNPSVTVTWRSAMTHQVQDRPPPTTMLRSPRTQTCSVKISFTEQDTAAVVAMSYSIHPTFRLTVGYREQISLNSVG